MAACATHEQSAGLASRRGPSNNHTSRAAGTFCWRPGFPKAAETRSSAGTAEGRGCRLKVPSSIPPKNTPVISNKGSRETGEGADTLVDDVIAVHIVFSSQLYGLLASLRLPRYLQGRYIRAQSY